MSYAYWEYIMLLMLAAVTFGIYGGIRKYTTPHVHVIPFTILYVFGQMILAFIVWAALEFPIETGMSTIKVIYIFLGGIAVLVAEFLFLACMHFLNTSTAVACLSIQYAVGITLDYYISSSGISLEFLVLGSVLSGTGLILMILAEYFRNEDLKKAKKDDDHNRSSRDHGMVCDETTPILAAQNQEVDALSHASTSSSVSTSPSSKSSIHLSTAEFSYWIFIGLLAGVLCAMWSVLPALGTTGSESVDNPAIVVLVFIAGQIACLPFVIYFFGFLDLAYVQEGKPYHTINDLVVEMSNIPNVEIAWSLTIGVIVAAGYEGYFYGSSGDVPIAVSYALMMNGVLIATIVSVFILNEFSSESYCSLPYALIIIGFMFYVVAVCVLIILAVE